MGGPSHLVKLRQGAHLRGAGTETIDRSSSTRGVAWRSTGSRLAVAVLVVVVVSVSGVGVIAVGRDSARGAIVVRAAC